MASSRPTFCLRRAGPRGSELPLWGASDGSVQLPASHRKAVLGDLQLRPRSDLGASSRHGLSQGCPHLLCGSRAHTGSTGTTWHSGQSSGPWGAGTEVCGCTVSSQQRQEQWEVSPEGGCHTSATLSEDVTPTPQYPERNVTSVNATCREPRKNQRTPTWALRKAIQVATLSSHQPGAQPGSRSVPYSK